MEVIDKSILKPCNRCKGNGCSVCDNGKYKESNYILIAQQEDGQKIAFQSEFAGK